MTNFIKIQPYTQLVVPDYFPEEREVDVQVNLRISEDGVIYWGPMECSGSIHKNKSLPQLINEFMKSYEDDGYKYVELKTVLIDQEFLEEYKAYCKTANKPEADRLMKVVKQMLDDL